MNIPFEILKLLWRSIKGDLNDLEKANLSFMLVFGGGLLLIVGVIIAIAIGAGWLLFKLLI